MEIRLMEDSLGDDEFYAVIQCLKSGKYTQGETVEKFEKRFAEWNGSKYAVMVNSGSSANLLMAYMLKQRYGLKDGDEVLVPSVTWPTTVYPIIQHNLVPVFCDVDDSFNISPESIKKMVSQKTKAIFAVHLLGQPAEIAAILRVCKENGLLLLEDCCESLGACIRSRKVGNFGLMGSFSFYFAHHITTIEGGMIVTDDRETYDMLKSARSHGWVRGSDREKLYPGMDKAFLFDMLGYNLRSTNLNASIGLVQLDKLDRFIAIRRESHAHFVSKMRQTGLRIQKVDITQTSSFAFAVICNDRAHKEITMSWLRKNGVEVRPIVAGNLLNQPVFKSSNFRRDKLANADIIDACGFYFGNNHTMTPQKIDYAVSLIMNCPKD